MDFSFTFLVFMFDGGQSFLAVPRCPCDARIEPELLADKACSLPVDLLLLPLSFTLFLWRGFAATPTSLQGAVPTGDHMQASTSALVLSFQSLLF